jgi:hypothetical protein
VYKSLSEFLNLGRLILRRSELTLLTAAAAMRCRRVGEVFALVRSMNVLYPNVVKPRIESFRNSLGFGRTKRFLKDLPLRLLPYPKG